MYIIQYKYKYFYFMKITASKYQIAPGSFKRQIKSINT